MKLKVSGLIFLLFSTVTHCHDPASSQLSSDSIWKSPVYLMANNNKFLKKCFPCGAPHDKKVSSAGLDGKKGDDESLWVPEQVGDKIAFKTKDGKYLSRCNDCWQNLVEREYATVDESSPNQPYAQWTPEKVGDKYTFKADNGKYLAICNGCVKNGTKDEIAFIHYDKPIEPALWQVIPEDNPWNSPVYIIADNGEYLERCYLCGPAHKSDFSSAGVHGRKGDAPAVWTPEKVGDKYAFKADTGKYLARCRSCWQKSSYSDSAGVHESDPNQPYAQWTPEKVGDKYAFKADTGKYLARCSGCVQGGTKGNFAFVHYDQPTGPALWKVEPV